MATDEMPPIVNTLTGVDCPESVVYTDELPGSQLWAPDGPGLSLVDTVALQLTDGDEITVHSCLLQQFDHFWGSYHS